MKKAISFLLLISHLFTSQPIALAHVRQKDGFLGADNLVAKPDQISISDLSAREDMMGLSGKRPGTEMRRDSSSFEAEDSPPSFFIRTHKSLLDWVSQVLRWYRHAPQPYRVAFSGMIFAAFGLVLYIANKNLAAQAAPLLAGVWLGNVDWQELFEVARRINLWTESEQSASVKEWTNLPDKFYYKEFYDRRMLPRALHVGHRQLLLLKENEALIVPTQNPFVDGIVSRGYRVCFGVFFRADGYYGGAHIFPDDHHKPYFVSSPYDRYCWFLRVLSDYKLKNVRLTLDPGRYLGLPDADVLREKAEEFGFTVEIIDRFAQSKTGYEEKVKDELYMSSDWILTPQKAVVRFQIDPIRDRMAHHVLMQSNWEEALKPLETFREPETDLVEALGSAFISLDDDQEAKLPLLLMTHAVEAAGSETERDELLAVLNAIGEGMSFYQWVRDQDVATREEEELIAKIFAALKVKKAPRVVILPEDSLFWKHPRTADSGNRFEGLTLRGGNGHAPVIVLNASYRGSDKRKVEFACRLLHEYAHVQQGQDNAAHQKSANEVNFRSALEEGEADAYAHDNLKEIALAIGLPRDWENHVSYTNWFLSEVCAYPHEFMLVSSVTDKALKTLLNKGLSGIGDVLGVGSADVESFFRQGFDEQATDKHWWALLLGELSVALKEEPDSRKSETWLKVACRLMTYALEVKGELEALFMRNSTGLLRVYQPLDALSKALLSEQIMWQMIASGDIVEIADAVIAFKEKANSTREQTARELILIEDKFVAWARDFLEPEMGAGAPEMKETQVVRLSNIDSATDRKEVPGLLPAIRERWDEVTNRVRDSLTDGFLSEIPGWLWEAVNSPRWGHWLIRMPFMPFIFIYMATADMDPEDKFWLRRWFNQFMFGHDDAPSVSQKTSSSGAEAGKLSVESPLDVLKAPSSLAGFCGAQVKGSKVLLLRFESKALLESVLGSSWRGEPEVPASGSVTQWPSLPAALTIADLAKVLNEQEALTAEQEVLSELLLAQEYFTASDGQLVANNDKSDWAVVGFAADNLAGEKAAEMAAWQAFFFGVYLTDSDYSDQAYIWWISLNKQKQEVLSELLDVSDEVMDKYENMTPEVQVVNRLWLLSSHDFLYTKVPLYYQRKVWDLNEVAVAYKVISAKELLPTPRWIIFERVKRKVPRPRRVGDHYNHLIPDTISVPANLSGLNKDVDWHALLMQAVAEQINQAGALVRLMGSLTYFDKDPWRRITDLDIMVSLDKDVAVLAGDDGVKNAIENRFVNLLQASGLKVHLYEGENVIVLNGPSEKLRRITLEIQILASEYLLDPQTAWGYLSSDLIYPINSGAKLMPKAANPYQGNVDPNYLITLTCQKIVRLAREISEYAYGDVENITKPEHRFSLIDFLTRGEFQLSAKLKGGQLAWAIASELLERIQEKPDELQNLILQVVNQWRSSDQAVQSLGDGRQGSARDRVGSPMDEAIMLMAA